MNTHGTLRRTVDPMVEPVTLEETLAHLVGYNPADSVYITGLITVARETFESETGLCLVEQSWELTLPRFQYEIQIRRPPLISIDAVTYYDENGVQQTLPATEYRVSPSGQRSVMTEAYAKVYPSTELERPDAVKIAFRAGIYGVTTGPTPAVDTGSTNGLQRFYPLAQQAIKILVDHLYRNKGAVAPVQLSDTPLAYRHLVNLCTVSWL